MRNSFIPFQLQYNEEDIASKFKIPQMLKLKEEKFLELTDHFSAANFLARGTLSTVYKGTFPDGSLAAVKRMELSKPLRSFCEKSFFAELHVLRGIRHRNIVSVLGYFSNLDTMAVILEYMPKGSLQRRLSQRHTYICLDWNKRYKIALGVAEALAYMHHNCKQQIVHCDLKPSNILLDNNFEAHVGNFGLAKTVEEQMRLKNDGLTTLVWSPGYTAPELFEGEKPSPAADVYSFGILLLQLLTRKSPTDFRDGLTLRDWSKLAMDRKRGVWTDVLDLQLQQEILNQSEMLATMQIALACSREAPSARPNMKTVVNYLVKLRDNDVFKRFNKPTESLIDERCSGWGISKKRKPFSLSTTLTETRDDLI